MRAVVPLVAITLAGAALRVWLADARPLTGDEGLTWRTSGRTLSDFLVWDHHGDHPPLSFMLVRVSLEAFGRSVWTLRSPSLIAGILCIPAAWLVGRRLGIGLLLAALVAFDPVIVVLSSLARMYALLALLTLTALWRVDALGARDERRAGPWLILGAILLVATWTHYLGYVLAASTLAALAWRSGLRPAALAAIPPLVGALAPLARAVRLVDRGRAPLDRLRPTGRSTLVDGTEAARFVIERAGDLWPLGVAAPLLTLAGVVGIARLARRSPPLGWTVAVLALVTLAAVIVSAPGRPFGVDRYLLPWRLTISIGLAALALSRGRARAAIATGVAVLGLLGVRAAVPTGPLPGFFAAGALARDLVAEVRADEIVAVELPYLIPMATWYGLPVEPVGTGFPRRPDGSLPARTWLLITSPSDAPSVPGTRPDRGRYRAPVESLTPELEAAYGARVDRDALERVLRSRGAAAIAFGPGSTAIRAPAP